MHLSNLARPLVSLLIALSLASAARAAVGDTRVAKWKDDRAAAFLLMFDDGWVGHAEVAIPEIQKRWLVATFYMNPEKGEYKQYAAKWPGALKGGGVVYGNHTMTHRGVTDMDNARREIGECARLIREQMQPLPAAHPKRLVSFAQPGVGPGKWNINKTQLVEILKENKLVDRPPFAGHGAVHHWKTLEEMTALAEKGIAATGFLTFDALPNGPAISVWPAR